MNTTVTFTVQHGGIVTLVTLVVCNINAVGQLIDKGVIYNSFSLCYGGMDIVIVLDGSSSPKDMEFVGEWKI